MNIDKDSPEEFMFPSNADYKSRPFIRDHIEMRSVDFLIGKHSPSRSTQLLILSLLLPQPNDKTRSKLGAKSLLPANIQIISFKVLPRTWQSKSLNAITVN